MLVASATTTARTNGVMSLPATTSMGLWYTRFREVFWCSAPTGLHPASSLPMKNTCGCSSGGGAKAVSHDHSEPGGGCERRYCTSVARATIVSPCTMSHSELRIRWPSRTNRDRTEVGTRRAALNRSTVNRDGRKSGSP